MRPSAAIRTACSVASAVSGSSGARRADVVRLVDDDQHRLALARAAATARRAPPPATSACSSRVAQRAEVDDDAARAGIAASASSIEPGSSRAQTPKLVDAEVAGPRARSRRALGRRRAVALSASAAALGEQRGELGVLLAVGDRVEPQQRRLRGRLELAQPQPQPLAPLGARPSARRPSGGRARSARRGRVGARRGRGRGARSPSSGRARRCAGRSRAAAARASRRASRSCPSPTGRTGTCAGRSRRRRAAHGTPGASAQLADLAARARGARSRASSRAPRRASAGRISRVVERRAVALEQRALAAGVPDRDARAHRLAVRAAGQVELGAVAGRQLEREHLPEPGAGRRARATT